MDTTERAVGAYLGLALGDALGATVEFMTTREIRAEYGVHDRIRGGGWLRLRPGRVTDDTEMALALGASIIACGRVEPTSIAAAFDAWMRRRPVDIGGTVRRGILHYRASGCAEVPPNEHDAGNGACMRVLPVALYTLGQPAAAVAAAVQAQNHVTHNHPLSDLGTLTVVEMVHLALTGAPLLDLLHGPVKRLTEREGAFRFRGRRWDNPSGFIVDTLRVVFQGLFDTEGFEQCLVETVNRGGDADTTGAIVGMLAGALYGAAAIPRRWLDVLDPAVAAECRRQAAVLVGMASGAAGVSAAAADVIAELPTSGM